MSEEKKKMKREDKYEFSTRYCSWSATWMISGSFSSSSGMSSRRTELYINDVMKTILMMSIVKWSAPH